MFEHDPAWLPLLVAEVMEPLAAERGVSEVARSRRGFMTAYKLAGGEPTLLGIDHESGQHWTEKRRLFVNRHLGAARKREEKMWLKRKGEWIPSRRHLALIMWAYTPTPNRLGKWLRRRALEGRT